MINKLGHFVETSPSPLIYDATLLTPKDTCSSPLQINDVSVLTPMDTCSSPLYIGDVTVLTSMDTCYN